MNNSMNRSNWGRIFALAVIVVLILGLGFLRFAPKDGLLSVPAGAKAGDLILEPCTYDTEAGDYDADCGTLVVPENHANPHSRLIALPVIRIRALSDNPAEPIFPLEGGPGITNTVFMQASRYVDNHDVVLVGYRGVDGSVRLDCPEVSSAIERSSDWTGDSSFRAYGDALRACADRLSVEGVDLEGYGLPQQVDDFEAARVALGYERINLLSQSAGTRTALIYAWRFPDSIHRSVMIGVNPPGHFLWDPAINDEQVRRYAEHCARDTACSTRTDDLAASFRQIADDMPERWLFLPINASSVKFVSFFGLMESHENDQTPIAASTTLDAWLSAAEGDASGLWVASIFTRVFPIPFVWGEYADAGILDAQAGREYFSTHERNVENLGWVASAFVWGGGELADAWPNSPDESEYREVRRSEVETLLISGELDVSTPPQGATEELLPYLANGHQVILEGLGHTGSFFAEQPEASNRLINAFFDSGQIDDSLYTSIVVDFTPEMTLTWLANAIASIMIGLALIMIASLVWMAYHVRTRASFGRPASAALRSVFLIVLGLGGWFLGALIVLTFLPTVPLYSQLTTVVSVGVPIGIGTYLAWVHRDMPSQTRTMGFVVAMGSALVGGWLGFNATDGFLALITTIVGAAALTNLSLILFEVWRERSVREPLRTATPPLAHPSTSD
jgi:pimeloyl-ACP methyl ester carboxylesterase